MGGRIAPLTCVTQSSCTRPHRLQQWPHSS